MSKAILKKINIFAPPKEAAEAGHADFRPVSGWKPLFHMEPGPRTTWINEDLAPTPKQMRVWTWFSYVSLWYSANYSAGSWSTGASLVNAGLTVNQCLGVSLLGCLLTSCIGVAAARVGAVYHIGYPTWARSTFGMYGSKIMVAFRGCVAIIWYAVQTYYGAQMMSVTFWAIFGHKWNELPNSLPASANVTTKIMVCYLIMWLIQVPFAFIHPSTSRHIFSFKSFFLPISAFAFIGGVVHLAGGSVHFSVVNPAKPATGSAFSWAFLTGLNAIFGTISPMLINQPDIGRYASTRNAALWPQLAAMISGKFICFVLGIVTAAACKQIFGVTTWNVWTICNYILADNYTTGWRVGLGFFGIVQCFGTVATNLYANAIPFGCDAAGVFPKHINIVRGQIICMVFSWAICPWSILTSGAKFITFLGSYTVFMAAVMGILLCDYYLVKKGNIHIPSLYSKNGDTPDPNGIYMPKPGGYELFGFISWFAGIILLIPGLAFSYTTSTSKAAVAFKHMYNTGFLIAFFLAGLTYLGLCYFVRMPEVIPLEHRDTFKPTWEHLAETEGYFPGEPEIFYGRSHMSGGDEESDSAYLEDDKSSGDEKGIDGTSVKVSTLPVV